jgi:hypothetical protein
VRQKSRDISLQQTEAHGTSPETGRQATNYVAKNVISRHKSRDRIQSRDRIRAPSADDDKTMRRLTTAQVQTTQDDPATARDASEEKGGLCRQKRALRNNYVRQNSRDRSASRRQTNGSADLDQELERIARLVRGRKLAEGVHHVAVRRDVDSSVFAPACWREHLGFVSLGIVGHGCLIA